MPRAREVRPELLDSLPPDNPEAIASRRDLARVNAWMRQAPLMTALLCRYGPGPPARILELGCGDGTFMLSIASRLANTWPGVHLTLVDRQPLVTARTIAAFSELGWTAAPHTADVFDALQTAHADIVTANLFLHHFEAPELRALLAAMARSAPFAVACEPRRSALAAIGCRLMVLIGCNRVTRHDALVSVRAGFTGTELTALSPPGWRITEAAAGLFTHAFVATSLPEACS